MRAEKNIFVVEDESIVALEVQDRLRDLGYGVAGVAPSGEKAIEILAETEADLVLMDITLRGELDGIRAGERIQALYDIPVIFLSAHSDRAVLDRAKKIAPFGYILKPFDEKTLQVTIETGLVRHAQERKIRAQGEEHRKRFEAAERQLTALGGKIEIIAAEISRLLEAGDSDAPAGRIAELIGELCCAPEAAYRRGGPDIGGTGPRKRAKAAGF